MRYRTLGRTGLNISVLSFGAGPVSGLMTGDDQNLQQAVLKCAVRMGVNWIDTAPGYGQGKSEANIGKALRDLPLSGKIHIATKVRLQADQLGNIRDAVRKSVEESLARLGVSSLTLLQLHNGITKNRGDEPFSLCPDDILGPDGVAVAFQELRKVRRIGHMGLTGTGHPDALREVLGSGLFDTIQVPYHLLNPSAGHVMPEGFAETNFDNIISDCTQMGMGVLAIRIFAGGALLNLPPSAHTLQTPFFPLALYERDRQKALDLGTEQSQQERALRFVLDDSRIHSAIVGFGAEGHVEELASFASRED